MTKELLRTDIELVKQIVNGIQKLHHDMYVEEDEITFKEEFSKLNYNEQSDVMDDVLDGIYYTSELEKLFIRLHNQIKESI